MLTQSSALFIRCGATLRAEIVIRIVGKKKSTDLHRLGLRFGPIPMDKIAQRSQANGVLGLCIAQCDLLGVSTAGKKLIRR